ncbi:hypothetical protein ACFQ60_06645 [Streptomyces zhihengii]
MRRADPSARPSLTRRGVLATAAALAGTAAVLASADRATAAPRHGEGAADTGDLVVEGGTLLDPATGEVTEDAVVVVRDGVVRAAARAPGCGSRTASRASTPTATGSCRD